LPQPIPGGDDLKLWLFGYHVAFTVERDAIVYDDADVDRTGAALVQSFKQFQMRGKDPDATADKLV
jgi:hypothetical protein